MSLANQEIMEYFGWSEYELSAFDKYQLVQLLKGIEDGVNAHYYAYPEIGWEVMFRIRTLLKKGYGIDEIEEMLTRESERRRKHSEDGDEDDATYSATEDEIDLSMAALADNLGWDESFVTRFDDNQRATLHMVLSEYDLKPTEIGKYANPDLDFHMMDLAYGCLREGWDVESYIDIESYANLDYQVARELCKALADSRLSDYDKNSLALVVKRAPEFQYVGAAHSCLALGVEPDFVFDELIDQGGFAKLEELGQDVSRGMDVKEAIAKYRGETD